MFCQNCGAEISDKAVVCIKCGVSVTPARSASQSLASDERSIALALCATLGCFGAHRFYTKDTNIAIVQLILGLVSCFIISGIWALFDFAMLLSGSYRTGDGRVLT